ncbi:MAG TPA: cohesin domain-containing protein [Terriglobales bacterium]|nr:cohesin domain-containing protein [Terriglobales bacterium]
MHKLTRWSGVLLLLAAVSMPAFADKAKSLYNKGREAEAQQDYVQAYQDYRQAYNLKPDNLYYRTAFERLRFLAAATKVHQGQLLRQAGQLQVALKMFQEAAAMDPSSFIATQEIKRTQDMIQKAQAAGKEVPSPTPTGPLGKMLEQAGGPVELAPISNTPITLKMTEDSKVAYETIGKLAGINVLFDPDYTSRRIHIELNGVTLQQALEIVALESKTFWRPVTPNTIFVAADNPAKRKELEQSVIKTFYLSNLSAPTELQDVVNAMRTILEVSRIQQLPSQNAIVVRGTPDQVALAEKLIGDIDKAKPEVVVDIAVMQVNREKIRTLGINPPTSATVTLQPNVPTTTTTATTGAGNTGTVSSTAGTPGSISLNALGNLNATDFQVNISSATATALYSDNDSRILQQPEIRAVDGQKASLKIGERVPVATGSFQPGIGGVGINPLVNTQFQYLDVGVNIDVTPHVHADGSVTLKVMMDVSNVAGNTNIGGIQQPIIGQRKIEHEIRLREGEVNMLGGMFEHDDVRSLSGYPWLAQIPILHYFFAQSNVDRRSSEIVFVLTPHVVRGQFVSPMNERVIDVGTANSIDLRQASEVVPAAPGQFVPVAPAPAAAQSAAPPSANPQGTGAATLSFDPAAITQSVGKTFAVNVVLSQVQNLYSVPVQITYNPNMLEVVNVSDGNLLSRDGQPVALVHRDDPSSGTLQVTATRPPNSGGVSGEGQVFTITFMAKGSGTSTLNIARDGLRDSSMQPIPASSAPATVTVQ